MKFHLFILAISILSFIACDSDSSNGPNTNNTTPEPMVIDWNENPQSCTVRANKDSVFLDFTFQKWDLNIVTITDGRNVLSIQKFTGIDESFFYDFCNSIGQALNQQVNQTLESASVTCNKNVMVEEYTMAASLPTISVAEYANTMSKMCQQLLNGEISMKGNFIP